MKTQGRFLNLSAAIALATPLAVQAQPNAIEEVLVTAQKREQSVFDVPLPVDALPQDMFDKANVTQARRLLQLSTELTAASDFGVFGYILSSRGVSAAATLDPVVASYVDDIPYAFVGLGWSPSSNLFDLERVEIINGPQGTLYGQGSMAGTVRYISADPDATEFAGVIDLGVESITDGGTGFSSNAMVNLPIIEDQLAARLVYAREETGGYIDYPNYLTGPTEDNNDATFEDIRFKLLYTPSDELSVKFTYWHSEVSAEHNDQLVLLAPTSIADWKPLLESRSDPLTPVPNAAELESDAWSINISYDFGPVTVTNVFSQLDAKQLQGANLAILEGFLNLDGETTTNELRITSNFDGPFQFVAGHYYLDGETDWDNQNTFFVPVTFFAGRDFAKYTSEVSALFGEATLELMDGFVELLAGVRRFDDDRTFTQVTDLPPVPGDGTVPTGDVSDNFSSTNPRFNIAIHPSDDWMVYLNWAKGYRSGNFNSLTGQNFAAAAGVTDTATVDPDELVSIDLGTKFKAFDGMLSAEFVLYQSSWKDTQLAVAFNPAAFGPTLVNAGDLDIMGFEYNLTARPVEGLTLNLAGSYLDTEWDKIDPVLDAFLPGLNVGGSGLGIPDHQVNFSATYVRPITLAGQDLQLSTYADYLFHDRQGDQTGGPFAKLPTRKINLNIGLSDPDNWEASFYVENLTDETDAVNVSFTVFTTTPKPRTIGLSFKKYF